jgi:release factor glutamine methyltransferase
LASEKWTVKRLIEWTTKYLSKISVSPRTDAEILLSHAISKNRLWLYTHYEEVLEDNVLQKYKEFIKKRYEGIPVHHITGKKSFMALEFKINDKVLVPRPETEELVEKVIIDMKSNKWKKVVEVGCGSGVIAVSIAKYVPECEVWAIDINPEALEVTKENAKIHNVSERVHAGEYGTEPLSPDVVISNPPYLTKKEWEELPELHKEPYEALVGGEDGNEVYQSILERYSPKAFYFEIAHPFRKSLKDFFERKEFSYEILNDLSGRNRIAVVKKDGNRFDR